MNYTKVIFLRNLHSIRVTHTCRVEKTCIKTKEGKMKTMKMKMVLVVVMGLMAPKTFAQFSNVDNPVAKPFTCVSASGLVLKVNNEIAGYAHKASVKVGDQPSFFANYTMTITNPFFDETQTKYQYQASQLNVPVELTITNNYQAHSCRIPCPPINTTKAVLKVSGHEYTFDCH